MQIFDVAFKIIGGGEEGDKTIVRTKEAADHSLPYLIAVALVDGDVLPEQYRQDRIQRGIVQDLLRKVQIKPAPDLSQRFPGEMPCRIQIRLQSGRVFSIEKNDYEGFTTRPMSWDRAVQKFENLSEAHTTPSLRHRIIETVEHLEDHRTRELTGLFPSVVRLKGGAVVWRNLINTIVPSRLFG